MIESLVLEKVIDPTMIIVIQIWESRERYQAWRRSPDRAKLLAGGRGLGVREPSLLYRVLEYDVAR